jgi:phosphate-selective porin OprO/OprP
MSTPFRFLAAVTFTSAMVFAQPVDQAELQALRAQVQLLEQQLKVLSAKLEAKETQAMKVAVPAGKVSVDEKGFAIASAEDANRIRLGALLQFDSRVFVGDGGGIANTMFVLRRMRLVTDGRLANRFGFQFVPEFGGSAVSILDANLAFELDGGVQLKIGKFKTPLGLEALQSDAATSFTERSMVAGLLPGRDLGVQMSGPVANGRVEWTAGIFNGVADGATSTNVDFDEDKTVAGRVMMAPWWTAADSPLRGLTFGVAASTGRQKSVTGRTAGYRTDGQQTFFAYNPGVIADGQTWRITPQVDYRNGPLALMGEYVVTTTNVRPSAAAPKLELQHQGWQLTTGYVLTGETLTYGQVGPRSDFDPAAGNWGAFAVFGRLSEVRIDDAAFPVFASPVNNAKSTRSAAVGFTWFLSKAVVFKFDYYHSEFGFSSPASSGSVAPLLRQDEKAFITRVQLAF